MFLSSCVIYLEYKLNKVENDGIIEEIEMDSCNSVFAQKKKIINTTNIW